MKVYNLGMKRASRLVSGTVGVLVVLGWSGYILGAETKADNLTALESQGYKVVTKTIAKGEFVGCEFNLPVQFRNGMVFVCLGDQRGRAYEPDVTILRNDNGDVRVLIDGEEYRGTLTTE
jgi:hypothetical protein